MAIQNITQALSLTQDELQRGIINSIYNTDELFEVLPFTMYQGSAMKYTRITTLGDAQRLGYGATITAVTPATTSQYTIQATTYTGQLEINNLDIEQWSNIINQEAHLISSKARAVADLFRKDMIISDKSVASQEFDGLIELVTTSQTMSDNSGVGEELTIDMLAELKSKVMDKGKTVDFIMMNMSQFLKYKSLTRAMPGNTETVLSNGRQVEFFNGTRILINDYIPSDQTFGTGTAGANKVSTSIFAGNFDDGSRTIGIGAVSPSVGAVKYKSLGPSQTADSEFHRLIMRAAIVNYNDRGIACLKGVLS